MKEARKQETRSMRRRACLGREGESGFGEFGVFGSEVPVVVIGDDAVVGCGGLLGGHRSLSNRHVF